MSPLPGFPVVPEPARYAITGALPLGAYSVIRHDFDWTLDMQALDAPTLIPYGGVLAPLETSMSITTTYRPGTLK